MMIVILFQKIKEKMYPVGMMLYWVDILSNNTKSTIEKFLVKTNLTNYVSYYITLDDVNKAKPNDEGFNKIINHFDLELNEVILIGDSTSDEIIAKKNKIKFLFSNQLEIKNFNKIINDFE